MALPATARSAVGALQVTRGGAASGTPVVTGATLQTVHRGLSTARVTMTTMQIVGNSGTDRIRVASNTAQFVTQTIADRMRGAGLVAQMIRHGSDGARMFGAFNTQQTVYTTGVPDTRRSRAWAFDFDGHVFYVLDLGDKGALVYDVATQQWSKFETKGYMGHWDFKNGYQWRAANLTVGGSIVGGGMRQIDPTTHLDEGWRPVDYEARGVLLGSGADYHRQYALRLVGATGQNVDDVSPVLRMQFSDDQGVTWSPEHKVALKADTRQRIEFRSLGAFTTPGRIFRLYDEGGIKFLAFVEAEIGGEDGGNTPS